MCCILLSFTSAVNAQMEVSKITLKDVGDGSKGMPIGFNLIVITPVVLKSRNQQTENHFAG